MMKALLFLNIVVILNIQLIFGDVTQWPDGNGNILLVEEIVDKPANEEAREFYGQCFKDGCTTNQCEVDLKRMGEKYLQLCKTDPMEAAFFDAALEPCVLSGLKPVPK